MPRIIWLFPFLGLTGFATYFQHWNSGYTARLEDIASHPLAIYNHRDGRLDAEADLARDQRRLLVYGEPPAEMQEYQGLLSSIYRVQLESVTDEPTLELKRYAAAYNAVMLRNIRATFGRDALPETRELARRRHELSQRIANYVAP